MSDCNPCDLLLTIITKNDKCLCLEIESDASKDLSNNRSLYMSLFGKLKYVSIVSQLDLSFAVLASMVLRYLKDTFDLDLVFKQIECLRLVVLCDYDWGVHLKDWRSASGHWFEIPDGNTVNCWSSH